MEDGPLSPKGDKEALDELSRIFQRQSKALPYLIISHPLIDDLSQEGVLGFLSAVFIPQRHGRVLPYANVCIETASNPPSERQQGKHAILNNALPLEPLSPRNR